MLPNLGFLTLKFSYYDIKSEIQCAFTSACVHCSFYLQPNMTPHLWILRHLPASHLTVALLPRVATGCWKPLISCDSRKLHSGCSYCLCRSQHGGVCRQANSWANHAPMHAAWLGKGGVSPGFPALLQFFPHAISPVLGVLWGSRTPWPCNLLMLHRQSKAVWPELTWFELDKLSLGNSLRNLDQP